MNKRITRSKLGLFLDPKDLEKLKKFRERQERRGEMLPKPKNVEFGSLLGVVCSLYP
jgi:hypothetical protein